MTFTEAQKTAEKLFKGRDVKLETRNGVRKVVEYFKDENKFTTLGAGPSWLAAIKYATKPLADERNRVESERRAEYENERMLFQSFLEETMMPQFEAWKADRAPSSDAPVPADASVPQIPADTGNDSGGAVSSG